MAMLSVNKNNATITTVKNAEYCCIIHNISKSEATNLLKNSVLEDYGYRYKKVSQISVYSGQFYFLFF